MRKRRWWSLAVALGMVLSWQGVMAEPLRIHSGPQRTLMIELFTSQGCNSCPPAEAFLNAFAEHPRLWKDFIPLAFHVDYWDYLGWKDRYALSENASRQQRYAALGHVRGVYTPGIMVNGRGWRPGWFEKEPQKAGERAGELRLTVADNRFIANYGGEGAAQGPLRLNLALLGMGLATDIKRGENAGRHSPHEFVVLNHAQIPGEGPAWRGELPTGGDIQPKRLALVAWVSRPGDPTPVQAAGGFLHEGPAAR